MDTTLTRFHAAHARNGIYHRALREIQAGVKRDHWMWFIFPQLKGLAKSEIAQYYGIADRAEALAYINDPVLRLRLGACATGVLRHSRLIFRYPDDQKLRSSMTLFSQVAEDPSLANAVLAKFFPGPDQLTLDLLAGKPITLPRSPLRPKAVREASPIEWPCEAGPWTRERVTSYVRGFGLSTVAARQMVDAWMADRGRAMGAVWAARGQTEWERR